MNKYGYCDYCHKPLGKKSYSAIKITVIRGFEEWKRELRGDFCSVECHERWSKKTNEEFMKDFVKWFKSQNIKQITLTSDGKLNIEYHDSKPKEELSSNSLNNHQHKQELTSVKSYLQKTNRNSFNEQKLNDLEKKLNDTLVNSKFSSNEKPQDYKILWLSLGGIGLLGVGGLIGWLLTRKHRN
ncbi:hypothetical protein [endosymbiont GvMRE of Glomus versiforme]|uniref:hypothetical protein n=1 Tax=endosymbiont GvMRE of Glomus versiforme TaxID=2039283 RepID=UPI000EC68D13|nr:hypothetical protein [endosymbiont GvMRE of Glomus versiforme]RHZ36937.1 hypothetical protein GvMRE_I2g258 [endosymbiont GvMRE of Glomus versiforme]